LSTNSDGNVYKPRLMKNALKQFSKDYKSLKKYKKDPRKNNKLSVPRYKYGNNSMEGIFYKTGDLMSIDFCV